MLGAAAGQVHAEAAAQTHWDWLRERRTLPRKPNWPSMRVETMSMSVTPDLSTMLVITAPAISLCLAMSVPSAILHLLGRFTV